MHVVGTRPLCVNWFHMNCHCDIHQLYQRSLVIISDSYVGDNIFPFITFRYHLRIRLKVDAPSERKAGSHHREYHPWHHCLQTLLTALGPTCVNPTQPNQQMATNKQSMSKYKMIRKINITKKSLVFMHTWKFSIAVLIFFENILKTALEIWKMEVIKSLLPL